MPNHELKLCPRCNRAFECKPGNITQCRCNQVVLNNEEKIYIDGLYNDCLCTDCLIYLKTQYTVLKKALSL